MMNNTININTANMPKIYDFTAALPEQSNHFSLKIGGTTYEVTTHFNADGRKSVLQQFEQLILENKLI